LKQREKIVDGSVLVLIGLKIAVEHIAKHI